MKRAKDKRKFRRTLLLRYLTRLETLAPIVGGLTLLLASWAFKLKSGLAPFAGIVSVLVGFGSFVTRLLTGSPAIEQRVVEEISEQARQEREQRLDDLERRLAEDGDPRTEHALRDLRTLTASFANDPDVTSSVDSFSGFDIVSGVNRLFAACVESLQRTLELWRTARKMATEEARKPILARREALIDEVRASIEHLGSILANVQSLHVGEASGSELSRIRHELDASLDVARRVGERMAAWEQSAYDTEPDS